nr:hypothetical protein [Tanacetum cinerariifolium]
NSLTISQQAPTRNRGKAIVNSPQPIYAQEPSMVAEDDEMSKDKEIDKLMDLISLSECQKPKRAKDAAYHREKMILCKQKEAGIQLNTEQADWRDDTDDDELEDQELEAHYMYMAQLQEVSPDVADSRPIFDDDHYNVEEIDQNDDDNDLAKERELLASLIKKLKYEIDESKNRNKFLETSNKVLIEKLKGEIEDFKNKNKSLESSSIFFKEANNRLFETNNLLYADYKKSEAELARRNNNDIYSTVDACLNACEMWKEIKRLKQGESINVQDLETNLYWEFGKFTSQDGESLESYYSRAERIARITNPLTLVAQQQPVYHPQTHPTLYTQNSSTRSQQAAFRNRRKAIVNSPQPIYDQEPFMVAEDDETSKDKEIDKILALISLSFKKIYKPTNNNLRTSSNTSRTNQDNSLRIRNAGYENQRIDNVAGARETVEDQELEAHYMYMAQLQEVSPYAADSGPIFDDEPLQKVSNDDHYNVFAMKSEHPEQSKSVLDTYPIEQDAQNMIIDSLDMSNDIKLKCEIDESKDRNKFLETSNKVLIEKLKGEIEDFKNKNKSLESSNNYFKEANNRLSETNNLLYTDFKNSEAELARRNSMEYASQMEIECAKIKLYKTRKDKELDKVIALENKVIVLDNIVYKTGQSVQTMNMLNNECRTSFAKPEFLKKAQRANPRLYDIGVIPTTSVSRPQLKSNPMGDSVMHNNSQGKKQDVEDHRRTVKFSKNKTLVTACNDSLNAKTLNVNSVCATCDTCVLNDKHDMCVLNSIAKPIKKTVASESNQKPRDITRKLYERVSKTCSWWYPKFTPSRYKWKPKSGQENVNPNVSMHLGNASRTANVMDPMTRRSTVSNTPLPSNSFAARRDYPIYRRLWVLKAHDGKSQASGTDLYSITLQDTNCPNLIFLMAKATSSQAWLVQIRLQAQVRIVRTDKGT